MAEVDIRLPPLLFGSSALISALLTLLLPETAGKPLPNTVEECKLYESKSRGMQGTTAPTEMVPNRQHLLQDDLAQIKADQT